MTKHNSEGFFKGEFIGMYDMNDKPIHEGDSVEIYHKGDFVVCKICYEAEWAMFCLEWPDGYRNKFPMNPSKYRLI